MTALAGVRACRHLEFDKYGISTDFGPFVVSGR